MSGDEVDTGRLSLLLKSNMGKTVERIDLKQLEHELALKSDQRIPNQSI